MPDALWKFYVWYDFIPIYVNLANIEKHQLVVF